MALITAAQARSAIQISGTGEDTLLDTLIARAGEVIARHCGYPAASVGAAPSLESQSYTLYPARRAPYRTNFAGYGEGEAGRPSQRLSLGISPVTAIASIYDDEDLEYGSDTLVASTDYTFDGETGEVWLLPSGVHGQWTYGTPRAIKVACTAGYATTPPGLQQAAMMLVKHWYDLLRSQGKSSAPAGTVTVSLRDETIPEAVVQILAPYVLTSAWLGIG